MNSFSETPEYGIETVSRNFKMPSMHYHNSYELYFLEVGTREYFVEDKFFTVSPGQFVLIPPGMLHRTGGEFCVRTLVHFTQDFLGKSYSVNATCKLLACFETVRITPDAEQLPLLKTMLERMHSCNDETGFAVALGVLLDVLSKSGKQEIPYGHMGEIVAYINENFASISNIDQIAQRFYISKYHLCRVFKKSMHVTIIDYLNQVKLRNARKLLELTDIGIGDIAQSCGFRSVAYFSSAFKDSIGQSPTEYRKRTRH